MAQNSFNLANTKDQETIIFASSVQTKNSATLLKTYLDQAFEHAFTIYVDKVKSNDNSKIILEIDLCQTQRTLFFGVQ